MQTKVIELDTEPAISWGPIRITSGVTKILCLAGLRETIAKRARFTGFKTRRANVQWGSADEAISAKTHWNTDVRRPQMQHYRWQRE